MESQSRLALAAPDLVAEEQESGLLARNRHAAALLGRWLEEDDAYDTEIWPLMEQELEGLRTRIGD
jgi:hypothetical protein